MSKNRTRREFLITSGTGVAVGLLTSLNAQGQVPAPAAAAALRVRKNVVSSAATKDLDSLRKGVNQMKKLMQSSPNDPRNWASQAFSHGNCNAFTFCLMAAAATVKSPVPTWRRPSCPRAETSHV